jgi:APA family basic amino acid/polyamine antiporter
MSNPVIEAEPTDRLPRVLGPVAALCIIVGSVIGSGIFIVPARVAQEIPAIGPIIIAWVVGGLFSLAGVLTLAELAAMLPHAGGPYVYLRAAFGPIPAFLFGWAEFLIIRAGSMATLASAFALYAAQLTGTPGGWNPLAWQTFMAVAAMVIVSAINVVGTRWGGWLQIAGTVIKVAALLILIALPFLMGRADFGNWSPLWPAPRSDVTFQHFMIAMVGVLWAYDGWVNMASLAEEIHDPERNMPRALIGGVIILITLYLSTTLAYHLVLPMPEVAAASTERGSPTAVSAIYCRQLLGTAGLVAISLVVMASTFISLNGNVLCGPRAYFALARDGLFPRWLAHVHPRFVTPARSIIAQTAWAIVLTLLGAAFILSPPPQAAPASVSWFVDAWKVLHETPLYDVLYEYVVFGATIVYALSIASVFVLRWKMPDLPRPYHTWGYPLTPLIFLVGAGVLLVNMWQQQRAQALLGLSIFVLGLPAYILLSRGAREKSTSGAPVSTGS